MVCSEVGTRLCSPGSMVCFWDAQAGGGSGSDGVLFHDGA